MYGLGNIEEIGQRRTSADIVFDRLYEGIISLELLPGAKISEVEVAEQFGVSRQPVRDAFSRLGNLDLLLIQPQRATRVRRFSFEQIARARFVRLALELGLAAKAAEAWDGSMGEAFAANAAAQHDAVARTDRDAFHRLDEKFHEIVATAAGMESVFELVRKQKAMIDRICVLSLKRVESMVELVEDHEAIRGALARKDGAGAQRVLRRHLSRIAPTIDAIREAHPDYFEEADA